MSKFLTIVIVAVFSPILLLCQNKLSLANAISLALKNSYDIQLAKDNLEISTINNNIGIAGSLPVVTANASDNETITSINQQFPDPNRNVKRTGVASNNLSANITGGILLFNGFRVKATIKRLAALQNLNQELLNAQIQNTIAAVITSYYDVVRQQFFLHTLKKSIEVSQQRISVIKSRKEVGLANNADIFQAEIDLNASIQAEQSQQLVIEQTKTSLLNLIVVHPDSLIFINDSIVVDEQINFNELRKLALKNPPLIAAEQQIKVNELIEKETAALRSPILRANTGFNLNNTTSQAGFILQNQSYGPFLGLNLSIPIYNGGINKRQSQIAGINTRMAKTQRDGFLMQIENGAVRTYQAYSNTLVQLKTAQKNYYLSKQLLDLVMLRFQMGQSTIIDIKLAQQSFENESFRLVNLAYTAKIAEIELKRLANILQPL